MRTNERLEKSKNKLEEELCTERLNKEEIERKYDEIYQTHQNLISHAERQADELELLQDISRTPVKQENPHHSISDSLKIELASLEENLEDEFPDFVESYTKRFQISPPNVRNSFRAAPRSLGIYKQSSIIAEPRKARKSPSEEYFILVTQAIKLNSPYMDVICLVSPKSLYELAMRNDIPFHKWHIWVEKQLNASYLESIYKKSPVVSRLSFH